jgi:hypothetical protein
MNEPDMYDESAREHIDMNFQEQIEKQIDALETGIEQLLASAPHAGEAVPDASAADDGPPMLHLGIPAENELALRIRNRSIVFNAQQLDQLIEQLANVRASMQPPPPDTLPPGWQFAATRNPKVAVKKQANGDRLLILRHTGHGWVPFTLTPDRVIELYMLLTQR